MFVDIVFYLFAAILVGSSLLVITTRNPVQSVLFLVLAFFNAAGLFVLLEAEFLAMILVMVYMGAVAILFLFVVMMLDIEWTVLRQGFLKHLPLGLAVGLLLVIEMGVIVVGIHLPATPAPDTVENTLALGRVLYTQYLFPFEVVSLVLLVALVGAVVLTLRRRTSGVKRQVIAEQIARRRDQAVELKKVASGKGA